jgi:hypothetical protein
VVEFEFVAWSCVNEKAQKRFPFSQSDAAKRKKGKRERELGKGKKDGLMAPCTEHAITRETIEK